MIKYLSRFLYILTGTRKKLVLLLLMTVLTSLLEALGVGIIGPFLNLASNPDSIHEIPILDWAYRGLNLQSSDHFIPILGFATVAIFLIKSIAYVLTRACIFKFTSNQKKILMSRLMSAYLKAPYVYHLNKNTATSVGNIVFETTRFNQESLSPLLNLCVNLIIICTLLLVLAQINLIFLVMITGILLLVFILFNQLGNKFREWGKIQTQTNQEMIRIINHSLGGLKETRVIGCESYFEKQMKHQGHKWARAITLFQTSQVLPPVMIQTALISCVILFVCASYFYSKQSVAELTTVMGVFALASLRLMPSSSQFIQAIGKIRSSSHVVDMIYYDLKEIEKIGQPGIYKSQKLTSKSESISISNTNKYDDKRIAFTGKIDLNKITYRYPGTSEDVIKNISLSIKKGDSIALIGKSGSGKTTLVDIFLGLLEPENGDICVDGTSVYANLRSWQDLIGYIPQSIFLTDDTIERNIAFGVPDELIAPERLNKAIKAAQLIEFVEDLPDGIKTQVGERGVRLSGGQRQRIGIARALYHEREILVLDEATAALDSETERLVSKAIESLAGTKTLIIIAHRLSTVEHCDYVYLLDKGRVLKSGSYQEVVVSQI